MAIMTNKQLIDQCKKMAGMSGTLEKTSGGISYYKNRYGYVLGGQGQIYSKTLAEKWGNERRAGKSYYYFVTQCKHWFGRRIVDCSGMIIEALRSVDEDYTDRTADSLYNNCTSTRGAIKTLPETPGCIVWKKGHIGVYIGDGLVIESRGYKYGVVVSKLSTQRWTNWGKLKDIEYIKESSHAVEKPVFRRLLKYKTSMMRGGDVKSLQKLLTQAGQKPGAIDGIFGKNTSNAVKSYQMAKKLKVDGIAGKNTITSIGGKWEG